MNSPAVGWIANLVRAEPAAIPWGAVVRTGVAVVTPVTSGMLIGQLGIGLLCSLGALAGALTDKEGPYGSRISRLAIVAGCGALGFVLGTAVAANALAVVAMVLAVALVSGVLSVLGNVASVATLQLMIYTIVASAGAFGPITWWVPPLCYLAGAAWALGLALLGSIGGQVAPERAAVADVYQSLAVLMEVSGTPGVEDARRQLTADLNAAYDGVISYRAAAGGRDPRVRRLAAVLNAATPLVEATVTLTRSGTAVPLRLSAAVRTLSVAIRNGASTKRRGALRTGAISVIRPTEAPELDVIERGLNEIDAMLFEGAAVHVAAPERPSLRDRLGNLWHAISGGPTTWLPTVRLVLCVAVAELVAALIPTGRPYWIVLTVAVVLKPDFGSVFARAVQRGLGTIVGVFIGSALLFVLPHDWPILIAIGLFAAALPFARSRNYGMFATFLTPVIVFLLDLDNSGEAQLVVSRLLDTVVGCAIVLLIGYLPWPTTWRSRAHFGERIATAAEQVHRYLTVALGSHEAARADATPRRQLERRRTYRQLSDLRVALQQALSEPPIVSRPAAAWWPAIVALERLTDAITATATRAAIGASHPDDAAVESVGAALRDFSDAIRTGRRAAEHPLPDDPALAGVVRELRTARAVVTGA
jgi:uncharacterized membrane protein YccC